jgi:hypothetical protein
MLAVLATAWLGACTSSGARPPQSLPGSSGPVGNVAANSAAGVALDYLRALFSGRFGAARRYVDTRDVNAFDVITASLQPGSLSSRGLAVGASTVRGATATVVITGTICSSFGPASLGPAQRRSPQHCTTNRDPHSSSPVFRVQLTKLGRRWWVRYGTPG